MINRPKQRDREDLKKNNYQDLLLLRAEIKRHAKLYIENHKYYFMATKTKDRVRKIISQLPKNADISNTDNPLKAFLNLIEILRDLLAAIPEKNATSLSSLLTQQLQMQAECEWIEPDEDTTPHSAMIRSIDKLTDHANFKSLADKLYADKWFATSDGALSQAAWKTIHKKSRHIKDNNFARFLVAISPLLHIKKNTRPPRINYINKDINPDQSPTEKDLRNLFFAAHQDKSTLTNPTHVVYQFHADLANMGSVLSVATPRNFKVLFFDILVDMLIQNPSLNISELSKTLAHHLKMLEDEVELLRVFVKKQLKILDDFIEIYRARLPVANWALFQRTLQTEIRKYNCIIDPEKDHDDFIEFIRTCNLERLEGAAQFQKLRNSLTYIDRIYGANKIPHNLPVDVALPDIEAIKANCLEWEKPQEDPLSTDCDLSEPSSAVLSPRSRVTSCEIQKNEMPVESRSGSESEPTSPPTSPRRARAVDDGTVTNNALITATLSGSPIPSRNNNNVGVLRASVNIDRFFTRPQEWSRAKKIAVAVGISLVIAAALTGLAAALLYAGPVVVVAATAGTVAAVQWAAAIGTVGVISVLVGIPAVGAIIGLFAGLLLSRRSQRNNALPGMPAVDPVPAPDALLARTPPSSSPEHSPIMAVRTQKSHSLGDGSPPWSSSARARVNQPAPQQPVDSGRRSMTRSQE